MISRLTVVLVLLTRTLCSQVCDKQDALDITGGKHLPNDAIYHGGIEYRKGEYFVDEDGREMGCVCLKKPCISKCCPFGFVYSADNTMCLEQKDDFDPPVWNGYTLIQGKKAYDTFHFTFGKKNCTLTEGRILIGKATNDYHVQEDGQLYIGMPSRDPSFILKGPDAYCIDTFVFETPDYDGITSHLDALICFTDEQDDPHYGLTITCMLISCFFILITVAVYAWVPELRNLHGKVLIAHLLCLFVGFSAFAAMQILLMLDIIYHYTCVSLTIVIYFSLESAFFWLNVMSFDIWWTFSGKGGLSQRLSSTRARFIAYCIYAFGIPTLLTILFIGLEFSGLPPHPLMPMLRRQGCFLYGNSKILYFYSPMLLVCLSNTVFFVLTAMKINEIKKQTSVLESKDNGTHDKHRKDRQRLTLYLKLFMVMGINWVLEVVSAVYPNAIYLWNFTDAYNVLIGLTIFIIFVCKRKTFRLIKKRYQHLRGDPMSRTQTTTSSRTHSSREDVPMGSIKSKF